ncbi:MAG: ATP-binding protein [Muribaculaceae bacterium]|nr:ATP-binding protein [Muribaculaceae bacterium]
MYKREIEDDLKRDSTKGKIICLVGPRQVGKTTLLGQIIEEGEKVLSLNCDEAFDVAEIENKSADELKSLFHGYDMVQIDEVQRVENIGLTLKKIADLKMPVKVIVTGSSSLGMRDKIFEPATGRLIEYNLYPLSLKELSDSTSKLEERKLLERRMIYGLYPEVVTDSGDAKRILSNLANNYLYKDILAYGDIRKPDNLQKLVTALALQIGSEVSYTELSRIVGIDKATVGNYIDLLEKCFVVFRLGSFSRNIRNEIQKGKKVYFYDNGIRNAVISNFAPLELRTDTGALWENLMVSERVKRNSYFKTYAKSYFWRTHTQKEIDYIEELDGIISAFEFKWNPQTKAKRPEEFLNAYPNSTFEVITPDNFWQFIEP